MCGITGFVDFSSQTDGNTLEKMVATLTHRGPDDRGTYIWNEDSYQVGFGQTRLSIIDLSQGGHQPMHYRHLSIVYNGEIYNYKEIKQELVSLGHCFQSESDTEAILHAYDEWGIDAVHRFIGMFTIALLDRRKQRLVFLRDRAGVKPLYCYWNDTILLFASELKAFSMHGSFEKRIDQHALVQYMQLGNIPSPFCIFLNAYKLEPGTIEIWDLKSRNREIVKYWEPTKFYKEPKLNLSYLEAKAQLKDLLINAFNYRMVSDVPVGVFLSGGYDSTAVTAMLQSDRTDKLKTFTIGFEEGNNEAPFARATANYLGTDHFEYICTSKEAQKIIPNLAYYYDEPFGDSSAIPTYLVSKMAREQVTVALSADAGDEIFAGYNIYTDILRYQSRLNHIPDAFKPAVAWLSSGFNRLLASDHSSLKHKLSGIELSLQENVLQQTADLYMEMRRTPRHLISSSFAQLPDFKELSKKISTEGFNNLLDPILARDYSAYLQNDILTKVDRATMAVSLEGREPLVDHRILEFSARLPFEFKRNGGFGKIILKDIVHDYVPKEMLKRSKAGFSLPIYQWLKNELCSLLDDYLNEESLKKTGLWNVPFCMQQVELFKTNKLHYSPYIWYLLMFQMWYFEWVE